MRIGGMVDIALGDTILRLSREHDNDAGFANSFIKSGDQLLTRGAMQAIAALRMIPDAATMGQLQGSDIYK